MHLEQVVVCLMRSEADREKQEEGTTENPSIRGFENGSFSTPPIGTSYLLAIVCVFFNSILYIVPIRDEQL